MAFRELVIADAAGGLVTESFVDVDTSARLEGVSPHLALREEFRGVVDLQVVAFPQDGLLCDPGAEDLVREALDLGADVVGGIPWVEHSDAEARGHVRRMCALAAANGLRVAMLVDDAGDAGLHTTTMLAEAMLEHGLVGRGVGRVVAESTSSTTLRLP